MHPLVEQIERLFLPEVQGVASEMRDRYSSLQFNVWHSPEGSLTDYQGYSLGIECVFPRAAANTSNNVALSVAVCHLASIPKLMADVVWGHPSGEVEAAFPDNRHSINEWPEATPEAVQELNKVLPKLIQAFQTAVWRAAPLSPPQIDFAGMTTNERLGGAGLISEWDAAAKSRDRSRMIEILGKVGLASQADNIADTVLANPRCYGF
jgi:hypothetical protein